MVTGVDGIVLRQTKTLGGRRMISLFTRQFGRISAGTSISEKGKNRSALAIRPFVRGWYELREFRGNRYINSAEVIESHYGIGEDIDRFMDCSYALEFCGKLLDEEYPSPELFDMTCDFLNIMEKRRAEGGTLLLAYLVKAMSYAGYTPVTDICASCGAKDPRAGFSVSAGGMICGNCMREKKDRDPLIYEVDFGIVNILKYILEKPITAFENLTLNGRELRLLSVIMKKYAAFHLDMDRLRSESLFAGK